MKKDAPNIVTIAIMSLITVFLWVGFSIYRTITKEAAPIVEETVLRDIDPNLNIQVLSQMEQRLHIEEPELSNLVQSIESQLPIDTQIDGETQDSTPSAELNQTPESTVDDDNEDEIIDEEQDLLEEENE